MGREHHPHLDGGPLLILRTNADGAEDFKLATTSLATPGRAHWADLVEHRPGVYVLRFTVLQDWLVRLEREEGLPGEFHGLSCTRAFRAARR